MKWGLCAYLLVFLNSALPAATPDAAQSAPPRATAHTRQEESSLIREHHLRRLDARLMISAHALSQSCRYESEVSTRPPEKTVALTFDDGPDPEHTDFILDVLKRYQIPATFFLIGQKAQQHPELVAKITAAHHLIGNHSWDHPNFHEIPVPEQADEVERTELLLKGESTSRLFRYPYGNSTCQTNDLVRQHGYRIVGWHVDSCDWAFDRTGSVDSREAMSCGVLPQNTSDFVEHVVATVRAHNGGIVLLHEIHPNTLKRLEDIVVRLKREGYTFSSIDAEPWQPSLR